jgi:multidrug efflux pump
VIAVFFIPMFFYVLESMSERSSKKTPASGSGPQDSAGPGSGAPTATLSAKREGD